MNFGNKNIEKKFFTEAMKNFEVKIYYSGYCSYKVEAINEFEAIEIARNLPLNNEEILSNLENWREADEAFKVERTDNKE
ncbi:MAG: hypothetical protein K8R58_12805 [Bacteroidales bacterium]|nr:hypothetical protein [Bacteroidales bacterium]